jgi:ubiquilin
MDPSMMQAMMSDPEMIRQSLQFMQQHPEFVQLAMNMAAMQSGAPNQNPSSNDPNPMMNAMLQSLLSQPQSGAPAPTSPAANQDPPEVRYESQLSQLYEMGFHDVDANIRALMATGGSVHAAVERLLSTLR